MDMEFVLNKLSHWGDMGNDELSEMAEALCLIYHCREGTSDEFQQALELEIRKVLLYLDTNFKIVEKEATHKYTEYRIEEK